MATNPSLNQLSHTRLQLKHYQPLPLIFQQSIQEQPPTTPSEWFTKWFPQQAKVYGCPFIEACETRADNETTVLPIAMNTDFFAAILGGNEQLSHKVIYFEPEMQFYFYDPADKLYKSTSDEKLQNLLRAYLIRCAEELPDSVHKLNLFLEFRSDKQVKAIVHRAKSILAADHSFFGVNSDNGRNKGPEVHDRLTRVFVEKHIKKRPDEILTVTEAFLKYVDMLKHKCLPPIKRHQFKYMVAPVIREEFDLGIRNDLVDRNSKQQEGWKGLVVSGGKN